MNIDALENQSISVQIKTVEFTRSMSNRNSGRHQWQSRLSRNVYLTLEKCPVIDDLDGNQLSRFLMNSQLDSSAIAT